MYNARTRTSIAVPVLLSAALLLSTLLPSPAVSAPQEQGGAETITRLPDLTTTTAGEPLLYLSTPSPVISSVLTVPPGGVSRWMTHPVPAYIYVLQGRSHDPVR